MFPRSNALEASERSIAVSIASSTETCHWIHKDSDLRRRNEIKLRLESLNNRTYPQISRRVVRLTGGSKLIRRFMG